LEQVPGVEVIQSGQRGAATSVFIRGGSSNANKVLLDGVPVNDIGGVGNFGSLRHDGSLSGVFHRLDYMGEISRTDTNNSLPNSRYHDGSYVANLGLTLDANTELRFTGRYVTAGLGQPNAIEFFGIADDSFEKDQDSYLSVTLQNQTSEHWHNLIRYGAARLRLQDVNP